MTEIEQLNKDNIDIVHHLAHDIWPHTFREILSKDQIQYMLDWMYDLGTLREQVQIGHLYYVLKEFNKPKGFIGLEPNYPDAGLLRIHKLYVLPNMQGKGFGRQLLNQAIDVAFDLDMDALHLNVNRFNKSVDFYKHVGFDVVGEEDIDIGSGYLMEDFIMKLQLRSK
jgi:GNAT superfamily N-acetyltransferase